MTSRTFYSRSGWILIPLGAICILAELLAATTTDKTNLCPVAVVMWLVTAIWAFVHAALLIWVASTLSTVQTYGINEFSASEMSIMTQGKGYIVVVLPRITKILMLVGFSCCTIVAALGGLGAGCPTMIWMFFIPFGLWLVLAALGCMSTAGSVPPYMFAPERAVPVADSTNCVSRLGGMIVSLGGMCHP